MTNDEIILTENEILKIKIKILESKLLIMKGSSCWKLTAPYRYFSDFIKTSCIIPSFIKIWKTRFFWKFRAVFPLYKSFGITRKNWLEQKQQTFKSNIHFSIIAVLRYSNKKNFKEMLVSVLNQTYTNWDFSILDFTTDEKCNIDKICKKLSDKEYRINYKKFSTLSQRVSAVNKCVENAKGEYVFILRNDDILHPAALFEIAASLQNYKYNFVYADEASFSNNKLHQIRETYFKPDFSPEYFLSTNYIRHCVFFKSEILREIKNYDVLSEYDLYLRLIEHTERILHVPKCLYFERKAKQAYNNGDSFFPVDNGIDALSEHFRRTNVEATVSKGLRDSCYKVSYPIRGNPLVSIIIPNYDHWKTLKVCLDSIKKSTWTNYEIIIVENNSKDPETFKYYESIKNDPKIKILYWNEGFNYSAINNFGFEHSNGTYIVLLNNDIEVISPNWLEEMLMYSQQDNIGAVGAKLYFPSEKIQHGGVIVTNLEIVEHAFRNNERKSHGYNFRLSTVQNYSAVTAACMMIPRNVYIQVDGLDKMYRVAFNDIDFCLKIRNAGYRIVWTPYAELYHYESESRGKDDTEEKKLRNEVEIELLRARWKEKFTNGDPYYNKNLDIYNFFKLKDNPVLLN